MGQACLKSEHRDEYNSNFTEPFCIGVYIQLGRDTSAKNFQALILRHVRPCNFTVIISISYDFLYLKSIDWTDVFLRSHN